MSKTVPVEPVDGGGENADAGSDQAARSYGTWAEVAAAVESGELAGEGFKPAGTGAESDPYAISTPEAFAWWAAYHAGDAGTFARLDADVDLTTDKHAARESAGNGSGEGGAEATEGSDEPDPGAASPVILSEGGEAAAVEGSPAAPAGTLWTPIPVLAAELDGNGHAVLFRTEGAGLADTVAETGAVRWLSLGRTQKQLDEAAAQGGEAAALAATSVITEGPRAGSVAGTNKGTIEGVVNRMPVSWEPGDAPAASALAGGIAGENDGRIRDCANLGDVVNANASADSAAAGIAAAGIGTVETSYNAASIRAAINGAYLMTTLTSDAPYEDLVRASFYLAPGNAAAYEGVSAVGASRPGALSPDELADAADLLNDGREGDAAAWRGAADAGDAAADGATGGYPAPAKPSAAAAPPVANTLSTTYASWAEVGAAVDAGTLVQNGAYVDKPTTNASGVYQIETPEDLAWFAYKVNNSADVNVSMSATITKKGKLDMTGADWGAGPSAPLLWVPIGSASKLSTITHAFSGTFDGGAEGNSICRLRVESAEQFGTGFIGVASGATIKNVHLDEYCKVSNVHASGGGTGAVLGMMDSNAGSTVENCSFAGEVSSLKGVTGGIVGYAASKETSTQKPLIKNCTNAGTVTTGGAGAAGIAGNLTFGKVEGCINSGMVKITASATAAGIISGSGTNVEISNCANEGPVTGVGTAAGIAVGVTSGAQVFQCTNSGAVTAGSVAAGVVGNCRDATVTVTQCSNSGSIEGGTRVGGIVGAPVGGPTISHSYNVGPVKGTGQYPVGGVVGPTTSTTGTTQVASCYNAGTVEFAGQWAYAIAAPYYNASDDSIDESYKTAYRCLYASDIEPVGPSGSADFSDAYEKENLEIWGKPAEALKLYPAVSLLNGDENIWALDSANDPKNNGYPVLAPGTQQYGSWSDVATDIVNGKISNPDFSFWPTGTGTKENPYIIKNAEGLALFANACRGGDSGKFNGGEPACSSYVEIDPSLERLDLFGSAYSGRSEQTDANGVTTNIADALLWTPICEYVPSIVPDFSGTFNGNNVEIVGLNAGSSNASDTLTCVGFIGRANGATITNVNIGAGGRVTGNQTVGGVVGLTQSSCTISHCSNAATVRAYRQGAGGIAGQMSKGGAIESCTNSGEVYAATGNAAGIVYKVTEVTVRDCSNEANVTAVSGTSSRLAAGIVSQASTNSLIEGCFNSGDMQGCGTGAGIVAQLVASTVCKCGNTGTIGVDIDGSLTSNSMVRGGIVGTGTIVSGQSVEGGYSALVENCYNTGEVRAESDASTVQAAGIVGQAATRAVTGVTFPIKNCYNAGVVKTSGSAKAAAIVGPADGGSYYDTSTGAPICPLTNCYYATDTAGSASSYGDVAAGDLGELTGKTEREMKARAFVYLLNGNENYVGDDKGTTETIWTTDDADVNRGFPLIGSLYEEKKLTSWAEVGEAVESGKIGGDNFIPAGDGTAGNPYQISTPEALAWFAYMVNTNRDYGAKSVKLMNDISLDGTAYTGADKTLANALLWTPIGKDTTNWFGGAADGSYKNVVFDGNGKTVDYLRVNRTVDYSGLLGCAHNCTISGVTIGKNSSVMGTGRVGGIAGGTEKWSGDSTCAALVKDCFNYASLKGSTKVGGIIGNLPNNASETYALVRCGNYGDITGTPSCSGGVVGQAGNNGVAYCFNRGNLTLGGDGRMVAGVSGQGGKVYRSYNAGKVNTGYSISGTYSSGTVEGSTCLRVSDSGGTAQGTAVSADQLKSWAAAYFLNGKSVGTDNGWTYDANVNDGYPSFGTLRAAADWSEVGAGVDAGLVGNIPSGTGADAANAYQITSPAQFAWFAYKVNTNADFRGKNAKITQPIDLLGKDYTGKSAAGEAYADCLPWVPIGDPKGTVGELKNVGFYSGAFDGGSQPITNLYVAPRAFHSGLFAVLQGATVENVAVASGQVNGCDRVAGIAAVANGTTTATIRNCSNAATVSSTRIGSGTSCNVGGVVGTVWGVSGSNAVIERCSNSGSVTGNREAGGIVGDVYTDMYATVKDCYNTGAVSCVSMTGGTSTPSGAGGIIGAKPGSNPAGTTTTVSNCYNAGAVTTFVAKSDTSVHAISSKGYVTIENCYYLENTVQGGNDFTTAATTKALTDAQLKSWAAAYALNGSKLGDTGMTWTLDTANANQGYPVFGGSLRAAADWSEVGAGVDAGLVAGTNFKPTQTGDSEADAYQISTPEALAWFAYKVNTENGTYKTKKAKLTQTINLAGTTYGGKEGGDFTGCLKWMPINSFSGDFNGGGLAVENLFVNQSTGGAGFFSGLAGLDSDPVSVHDFGVASGSVTGLHSVGGIAGVLSRKQNKAAVTVERCWNNASVAGTGKNSSNETMAGGIAGYALGTITNCYNTGSVTAEVSQAGGIAGSTTAVAGYTRVESCYNTGSVTAPSRVGAINGYHDNGKSPTTNCYYLKGSSSAGFGMNVGTGEATELTDSQLKSWAAAYALNGSKQGTPWTYDANVNNGYPSFGTLGAPSNWGQIGLGVDAGLITGTNFKPAQTGDSEADAYQISTPEALAWFAYKVNDVATTREFGAKSVRIMNDINLDGSTYTGKDKSAVNALQWVPLGKGYDEEIVDSRIWYGGAPRSGCDGVVFDGGGNTVDYMRVEADDFAGLIGAVHNATLKGIVVGENSSVTSSWGSACYGGIAGGYDYSAASYESDAEGASFKAGGYAVRVEDCVNRATIDVTGNSAGGVIGALPPLGDAGGYAMSRCANYGKVSGSNEDTGGGLVGQACGNTVAYCYNRGEVDRDLPGIANNAVVALGCYNAAVTPGSLYPIVSNSVWSNDDWSAPDCCYVDYADSDQVDPDQGTKVTDAQMKSWAAAYALNGGTGAQKVGDLTTWRKASGTGENSGYPVLCAAGESMTPAADWSEVGEWVDVFSPAFKPAENGTTAACSAGTPEALAWVAYKANNGMPAINVKLTGNDIDLAGENYRAAGSSAPLPWAPIGASASYTGTFDGGKRVVKNLSIPTSANRANAGLFGSLGTGAKVSALGVEVAGVHGTATAGGLAGAMAGGTVQDCYAVSKGGSVQTASGKAAGLIGSLGAGAVQDCYAAVTTGSAGTVASFANKTAGTVLNCYFDADVVGARDSSGATGYANVTMASILAANALNRGRADGVWTWVSGVNNNYPAFGAPVAIASWQQVGAAQSEAYLRNTAKAADGTPALSGTGADADNALTIATPEALAWFASLVNANGNIANSGKTPQAATTAYVKLAGGIDLSGTAYGGVAGGDFSKCLKWEPIGTSASAPFSGDFNGGENCVENLKTEGGNGFFGSVVGSAETPALVHDFGIKSGAINGAAVTGSIAGAVEANATLVQCWNNASVTGTDDTGGIVGRAVGRVIDCYNLGTTNSTKRWAGGIIGATAGSSVGGADNCYNAGAVSAKNGKGAVVGYDNGSKNPAVNSYYLTGAAPKGVGGGTAQGDKGAMPLTDAQLKSWAAAYALNGGKLGADGVWASDGASYPTFGELRAANDWGEVGLGVDAGLIAGKPGQTGEDEATAYELGSEAALAWFAYKSNEDASTAYTKCARITASELDLTGKEYGGTDEAALQWSSIAKMCATHGTAPGTYGGTFDGGGCAIRNLRQSYASVAFKTGWGLFGFLYGATVKNVVLEDVDIDVVAASSYITVGGIASQISGKTTVANCAVASGSIIGSVTNDKMVGGLVGDSHNGGGTIENCYVLADVGSGSATGSRAAGGILGRALTAGQTTMKNCYYAGVAQGNPICIGNPERLTSTNTYYDSTLNPSAASLPANVKSLATEQLQSWAAAYALNGGDGTQEIETLTTWCMGGSNTNGYPALCAPGGEHMDIASDWDDVGEWVDLFATNKQPAFKDNAYEITAPEALAWFAHKVNDDATTREFGVKSVRIMNDINLDGYIYIGGDESFDSLLWVPIGKGYNTETWNFKYWYGGAKGSGCQSVVFDGGGHTVDDMRAEGEDCVGLVGAVHNATIKGVSIGAKSVVTALDDNGTYGACIGGVAGGYSEQLVKDDDIDALGNGALEVRVEDCVNRAAIWAGYAQSFGGVIGGLPSAGDQNIYAMARCANYGRVTGEPEEWGGGLVGTAHGGTVAYCYNRGEVDDSLPGVANNTFLAIGCYNAATGNGYSGRYPIATNSIWGNDNSFAPDCYYVDYVGSDWVEDSQGTAITDAQMKSWNAAYWLNGSKYVGSDDGTNPTTTVWTTDEQKNGSGSLKNDGYPVFGDLKLEQLSVTLEPSLISVKADSPKKTTAPFKDALNREKPLSGPVALVEAPANPAGATLSGAADVDANFSKWGTDTANKTIALVAGNVSLAPSSATGESALLGTGLAGIDLHAAAAYTSDQEHKTSFVVSDANARYRVGVTVKPFEGSKTLDVTVPVESASSFKLAPDGEVHEKESAAKAAGPSVLASNNALPLAGRVAKVEPLAAGTKRELDGKEVNAVLNPAAASIALAPTSDSIADDNPTTPDNVKLFAAASGTDATLTPLSAPLYYDPKNGTVPLYFAVPGGTEARWKWGMDYTGTYLGQEGVFGYAVGYEVGLSASDLAAPSLNGTGYLVAPGVYATEPYAGGGQGRYEVEWNKSAS